MKALSRHYRATDTAWVVFRTLTTNLLVLAVGVGSSVLTARVLGAEGRGELIVLLLYPALLATFASLGLPTSIIFHTKRFPASSPAMFGWATAAMLAASAVIGALTWLLTPLLLANFPPDLVRFARWYVAAAVIVATLLLFFVECAKVLPTFNLHNAVRILHPTGYVISLAALWQLGSLTPITAAIAFLSTSVPVVGWLAIELWRVFEPTIAAAPKQLGSLFRYGTHVFFVDVLGATSNHVDKVFVASVLTPQELGVYGTAYALSRVLNQLQSAVASVMFPKTAGDEIDAVIRRVGRAFRLSSTLTGVVGLGAIFVSPVLILFLFGEEFTTGTLPFQLLVAETLIGSSAWILAQVFNATGRPNVIVVRQVAGLVVTVGLLFVLAPQHGITGVAVAMLGGSTVRFVVTLAAFPSVLGKPIPRLVPSVADVQYLRQEWRQRRVG